MADAGAKPGTMSLREFADHLGKKPGYITELRKAGRLVMDGRRVRVDESKRLIADTMDPAKAGVAARHARARAAAKPSPSTTPAAAPVARQGADVAEVPAAEGEQGGDATDIDLPLDNPLAKRRAEAQARTEEAKARKAERDEQLELGQLLEREPTIAALANFVTVLRNRLQGLPARLSPELGASDETRCKVLLTDEIEHALEDLERKFQSIGRERQ